MKRILVLVAILTLMAGMVYAAALDDGMTRDVFAHGKGRTVVSDGSVALNVWYVGSFTNNPYVGVSMTTAGATTLNLYDTTGVTGFILTPTGSWSVASDIATSINTVGGWRAEVGNDVTPGSTVFLKGLNITQPGSVEQMSVPLYNSCERASLLSIGALPAPNKVIRLRQIVDKAGGLGNHTLSVWDGSKRVWRWDVTQVVFATATSKDASPKTVDFVSGGTKGLGMSTGNKLTVTARSATSAGDGTAGLGLELTNNNISIIWDEF